MYKSSPHHSVGWDAYQNVLPPLRDRCPEVLNRLRGGLGLANMLELLLKSGSFKFDIRSGN
jgi:hypothetical protein